MRNEQHPNWRDERGKLYLVRCFECGGEEGRENWSIAISSGWCAWCGWDESVDDEMLEEIREHHKA